MQSKLVLFYGAIRTPKKDFLQIDAPCINPEILRLVMSIAAEHRWTICEMDISDAYLQAKDLIETSTCVRLAKKAHLSPIWNIHSTIARMKSNNLIFVVLIQVDNYIYAGIETEISSFEHSLCAEFDVGEEEHGNFLVYGCEIEQSYEFSITMTQLQKIQELPDKLVSLETPRRDRVASPAEATRLRSALGQMLFIGRVSSL
eukprot:IDg3113t1